MIAVLYFIVLFFLIYISQYLYGAALGEWGAERGHRFSAGMGCIDFCVSGWCSEMLDGEAAAGA